MSEEEQLMLDILTSLDDPENVVYKSAMHMLVLRPYIKIIYGTNPDGDTAFKFELSNLGLRVVTKLSSNLIKKEA